MALDPGTVVRVKPDKAYRKAVLATQDCTRQPLCESDRIPRGCEDTGHLLMVVEQSADGLALCPLSGFPHAVRSDLPMPEYIGLREADIIDHPTYLHVSLLTVVQEKYIEPRRHPKVAQAKAAFRGERLKYLLGRIRKHWGKKGPSPSDGAIKSFKA
jgi:hypothetical protein